MIKVLTILKKYKTNHNLPSYLNNDKTANESVISVASRWGHIKIVEYLIDSYNWEKKDIKAAKKNTSNKEI